RVHELHRDLAAEPVDLHPGAAGEPLDPLGHLTGAHAGVVADEVVARPRLLLDDRPAALGALRRPLDLPLLPRPALLHHADHLRDDLALLLDDHRVAVADVLLLDPRGVVHARPADGRVRQP